MYHTLTSLVAQMVKHLPTMWETWVQPLGQEDHLEKEMAIHSSILVWRIPMNRGAWHIAVHGVAKNWILRDVLSHSEIEIKNSKCEKSYVHLCLFPLSFLPICLLMK